MSEEKTTGSASRTALVLKRKGLAQEHAADAASWKAFSMEKRTQMSHRKDWLILKIGHTILRIKAIYIYLYIYILFCLFVCFSEKHAVRREKLGHINSHFSCSFQYLGDRNGSWG